MDQTRIRQLLDRLNSGRATESEQAEIESLIEKGYIRLEDLRDLSALQTQVQEIRDPAPSASLDVDFYQMLAAEQKKNKAPSWRRLSLPAFAPRLAWASLALVTGLAAGYFLRPGPAQGEKQIERLSQQVADLQEMMMLSLLESGSTTERLKAVTLTLEMDDASRKVTSALIQTLNGDENINVRLAALEALKPYATDSSVREALIRSIALQQSPLVQISLAELMVALQEKAAIKEFERIVESEQTPAEVKRKLKQSIEVLI